MAVNACGEIIIPKCLAIILFGGPKVEMAGIFEDFIEIFQLSSRISSGRCRSGENNF